MPVKVKGQVAREHSYLFSSISKRVAKEWYVRNAATLRYPEAPLI